MDRLWLDLVPGSESVHFEMMPECDASLIDGELEERMALAQKACSMVLALRKKVGINVKKPLPRLVIPVVSEKLRCRLEAVKGVILAEVNVKDLQFIHDTTGVITKKIKPNFKTLGKVYGKMMKEIAAAFQTLSQQQISEMERCEDDYVLSIPSGDVVLAKTDYEIHSEDMPGWLVASDGPLTIALDIEMTDELRNEGTSRELVNRIQNLRKENGFEVTDKVKVCIFAAGDDYKEIAASLAQYKQYVASQTLALSVDVFEGKNDEGTEVEWNEGSIRINVSKN